MSLNDLIETVLNNSKYYTKLKNEKKQAKKELLASWINEGKLDSQLLILYQKIRLDIKKNTRESLLDMSLYQEELIDLTLVKSNKEVWTKASRVVYNSLDHIYMHK